MSSQVHLCPSKSEGRTRTIGPIGLAVIQTLVKSLKLVVSNLVFNCNWILNVGKCNIDLQGIGSF